METIILSILLTRKLSHRVLKSLVKVSQLQVAGPSFEPGRTGTLQKCKSVYIITKEGWAVCKMRYPWITSLLDKQELNKLYWIVYHIFATCWINLVALVVVIFQSNCISALTFYKLWAIFQPLRIYLILLIQMAFLETAKIHNIKILTPYF